MSRKSFQFRSVGKKLPVTSVKFLEKNILAGIGGDLHVFGSPENNIEEETIPIFKSSVIHGITSDISSSKLCTYGGRQVAVLDINSTFPDLRLGVSHKWRCEDWVLSCVWVHSPSGLAVLSAHNVLTLREPTTGNALSTLHCVEKCILYSATILPGLTGWKDTVVVAGTVFQQIIVWAVADESASDRPVLHRLSGHKGVIFSVTYSERLRMICSTSDDRTVRVWSVAAPSPGPLTAVGWREASVTLSVTMFGHTARVWQSRVLADKRIVSIGEDSMLCLWDSTGKNISQRETHQGGGSWCVDVDEGESLVVTGGADGGVCLWPLLPPPATSSSLPPPSDTPRRVALVQGGQVVIVTEGGRVMVFRDRTWVEVYRDLRIASYCLLETSPSTALVALATINGHIIVLTSDNFETLVDRQVSSGKIYSLHWLSEATLLSCHDKGQLIVWSITESELEEAGRCHLPMCKERWTTSAVMCGNTVVYGDRAGNIHSSPVLPPHANIVDEVRTVRRAHSRLGVSWLGVVGGQVWSTGRDGTLRRFAVDHSDHSLTLVTATRLQMDWLAAVVLTPLSPAVVCFHESSVVLWDLHQRRQLLSLQCGGGHRSWSCLVDHGNFVFVFLKDRTAHLVNSPLQPVAKPVLLEGFHTREINSMGHIRRGWVVSGGEDGTVRLSKFSRYNWTTSAVEHNHLSSVRAVSVANVNNQFYLFSAGGRAQLKVWKVSLNESACLTEVASVMLREERKGRHWLNIVPVSDPETRYMDLHILPDSGSDVDVLAACSDSYLRVFHFDSKANEVCLVKTVKNSCYCMLRVSSFRCDWRTVVVTAATDGLVTFWEWPACEVVAEDRVHQSGVNGLSVSAVGEGEGRTEQLVASGGDDNSVVVSVYRVVTTGRLGVHRVDRWVSSSLHSSVVTGVVIVGDKVVCCGGDQRVTVLSWSFTGDCLSVRPVTQHCCSVPDLKGLAIFGADREKLTLSVYGDGMEVLELEEES